MISRRIGKCLFILLIVYLTVTVYIASTMLLSPTTGVVVDADYRSVESDDEDDMSNIKTNIFNEEKYKLFRIKNSESRKRQRQSSMNTTTKKSANEFLLDNIKTPEVKMDRQISKTKDVNVKVMLDKWKKKMQLLRHEHLENGNDTKLMHLKRILVNAPSASNTGNINVPNQNNEEKNTKKLVNKNNIVMDWRRKSVDTYKDLPRYHINMQSIPGEIKVYSAYLDERKPTKFIRIVLIGIRLEPKKSTVCKFLLADRSDHTVVTSQMTLYETCEGHNKYFTSYIGSCEVPGIDILLDQVGLAVDGGDMDLFMNVIDNGKKKTTEMQNFAICVPPLFGDVNVLRLTEFIELSRILGAQHFVFYPKFVSSEISSLLDYYQSLGIATVMLWNLTIPLNDIWYHGQSASVWDCLYRTMYKFRHVAFIDFDEFIVPKMQNTIPEFLTYLQEEQNINDEIISAYKFQSAFFDPKFVDDDMPKSMEMQQLATMNRTQRTRKLSKIRTKLVVNPINVFEVGIHHVSKPNEEHYQSLDINPKLAFIHHYRECKGDYGMNCKLTTGDTSMLKYNTTLVNRVKQHLVEAKRHRPPV